MTIDRLNHVAVVVPDLDAAVWTYRDGLGALVSSPQDLPEHGVTVAFVELPNSKVELVTPLGEDSPITAFLGRNSAGGVHHVCFEIDDVRATRDRLVARGMRMLGSGEPKIGMHGTLVELEEVRR